MAFDYKKEYKEFYMPKNKPGIIEIPKMNYIAVRGKGNPNEENGEYKSSIGLLYGIAFTIKMSYKGTHKIEGFFEYVVPPLEGLWWQENTQGLDYARKEDMHFISMIRLPDFVTKEDFEWAVQEATKKKKQDFSKVEFFPYDEGLCVQCMHIGSYDDEPATVDLSPILEAIKAIPAQESVENVDYSPVLADLAKQITELTKKVDEPQEAEIDLTPINDSIASLGEKIAALESKPAPDDSATVRQIVADAIKPLMDQVTSMREKPEERPDIAAIVRAELAAMPKPSHQVMMLDPQTGAIKKQITLQYGADGKATGATVEQHQGATP